jgi:hypothetical protein
MIVLDGEKVKLSSIVKIEGMYVYTKEGLKICPHKEEMDELAKINFLFSK